MSIFRLTPIVIAATVLVALIVTHERSAEGQGTPVASVATAKEMAEARSLKASLAGIAFRDIYVYDGDTIIIHHQRMRLLGFDAPEVKHPRCRAEVTDGIKSRDRLRQILAHAHAISIRPSGDIDRYHRPLIHLLADEVDVGTTLMAENLAVVWKPGRAAWRQRRKHWCGF